MVKIVMVAGFALSSGCAHGPTWQSAAERPWLELRSRDFVLSTDLDRSTALERFGELEEIRDTLIDHFGLIAPGPRPNVEPFHIVHVESCQDLAPVKPAGALAYVTVATDWSGARLMVTCEAWRGRRDVLLHEMTHVLTGAYFARLPPWLNEGLARYYETLQVEGGEVVIGTPPPYHLVLDRTSAMGRVPSFARLTSMREAFYAKDTALVNYVGAWKLVHLLSSADHRDRFIAYLRALHRGRPAGDPWRAAFGDIGDDRIAAEYDEYTSRPRLDIYRGRRTPPSKRPAPLVRALRSGEVDALWIQLYMSGDRSGAGGDRRKAVGEHLVAMARHDAGWNGLLFWRALTGPYLRGGPDRARTQRELRAYAAREPNDVRVWRALVSLELGRIVPRDYVGIDGDVPAGLVALEPDVLELVRHADTSTSLNEIGWYYALRRVARTGLAFGFRAVRMNPTCGECYDTLALLLYENGNLSYAVEAQERAVTLMGERGIPRGVTRRLELFRRAQQSQTDRPH